MQMQITLSSLFVMKTQLFSSLLFNLPDTHTKLDFLVREMAYPEGGSFLSFSLDGGASRVCNARVISHPFLSISVVKQLSYCFTMSQLWYTGHQERR